MLKKISDLFFTNNASKQQKIIHLIIISSLSILVYLNIFQNTFIMDDRTIFFKWPEVKNFDIPALLQGSYPERFISQPVYRPIKGVIHTLSYNASNNNPIFYHFQAILIHILITVLIYFIISKITKKDSLAFIAALIFAVHPIHTESITFMTASFDTIGALFLFLSFYLYIKHKDNKNRAIFYFSSLFFALLAFLTYEITLVLPLILILYDLCFGNLSRKNWKENIKYIPYFFLIFLYIGLRILLEPNLSKINYYAGNFYLTMLLSIKSLLMYIYLIFFPLKLTVLEILPGNILSDFKDANSAENFKIINSQTIFDPAIILTILIVTISIFTFFYFLRKKPIISFSLGWFYIFLLPVSNIFPLKQFIAERYEYISSFGLILLFFYLLLALYQSKSNKVKPFLKNLILLILISIVFFFSFLTIMRNFDYKDDLIMLKALSKQDNGGFYPKYYLGKYYLIEKDYEKSIHYLNLLANSRYDNIYKDTYYYLSMANIKLGKYDEAKIAYKKLIKNNPDYSKEKLRALNNLLSENKNNNVTDLSSKPGYKIYNYNNNFSFEYPEKWTLSTSPSQLNLINPKTNFNLFFEYDVLGIDETKQHYISNTKLINFGKLLQEGIAKIPSVDYTYVRIWDQNGTKIAHFILFNKEEIINIFAKPFDQEYTDDFNQILNSVKFLNN